ncbi:LuxR family transcriptional regulator [Micromonospora sp. NBC_00617]|uniref:LuxR family transcriptional regulator n=1 Tax=Micromonospora sp. NBC_00617 TaxID=2903587 RepID=UPI0030E5ADEA
MEKLSLTAIADGLLSHELGASSRLGMRIVDGGRLRPLRQTVIALTRGEELDEHEYRANATVQVLRGRVRVTVGDDTTDGFPGELLVVPGTWHTVIALDDTVVLLTAAEPTPSIAADEANTDRAASCQRRSRSQRWPVNTRLR